MTNDLSAKTRKLIFKLEPEKNVQNLEIKGRNDSCTSKNSFKSFNSKLFDIDADLDVEPVDPRVLVESSEDPVDVDAGHDHLRDQELNVKFELQETFLKDRIKNF